MEYFNPDGHLNNEGIALCADAIKLQRMQALPSPLQKHLEQCTTCQQEVVDFTAIMADVDQNDAGAHPYFDRKASSLEASSPRRLLFRVALVAAIALLLILGYQQFFDQPKAPGMVDQPKQETPEIKPPNLNPQNEELVENQIEEKIEPASPSNDSSTPDEQAEEKTENPRVLYAAKYTPNEELDAMINTSFRSSEAFEFMEPKNDTSFDENVEISFAWKGDIPLKLTILDNDENEIDVADISGGTYVYREGLSVGLYYFKIESESELLHLGRLYID